MALRLLEGFDHYGAPGRVAVELREDVERRHDGSTALGDLIVGRGGLGYALEMAAGNSLYLSRFDATQSETWIVGFAVKTGDFASTSSTKLFDSYYNVVTLYLTEGILGVRGQGFSQTEYCAILKPNVWYYIEIKIFHNNSTGTIEVHLDGNTVYSATSLDTWDADYSRGTFGLYATSANTAFDDIYICDGSGSDNNDFLGPIKIETLRPDGDDGSQNWSPSSGSNHYDLVNSANLWQVNDYVESNGANVDDLWTYTDISKINGTIYGAQAVASVWSDSSMPRPFQHICDSGNTYYSAIRGLGVEADYPMPHDDAIWENDPDTANAWTANGINAASFGIRKVA